MVSLQQVCIYVHNLCGWKDSLWYGDGDGLMLTLSTFSINESIPNWRPLITQQSILNLYLLQSNFFSALDDSDNEGAPAPAVAAKKKAPKKEVVEPSKVENRP